MHVQLGTGVTESLFWGAKGGGGGAQKDNRNDFFPITFIVYNHKSNGGGGRGGPWCEWGGAMPLSPPPIVTPLKSGDFGGQFHTWMWFRSRRLVVSLSVCGLALSR